MDNILQEEYKCGLPNFLLHLLLTYGELTEDEKIKVKELNKDILKEK